MLNNTEKNDKRAAYYKKNLTKIKYLGTIEVNRISQTGTEEYVLAPLMFSFVIWVLQQAKKNGINKLFFLARDGYSAYLTAKKICEVYHIEIECRYFSCSRYSLRVPMYSENIPEALGYICRSGIDVTFRKILLRSGFDEKKIETISLYFPDVELEKVIPYQELTEMKKRLAACDEYIDLLKANSCEKWDVLYEYFKQEGMLEDEIIGIVDSGWTGSTQKSINAIRKRCGCQRGINGYYFGLYEIPEGCDPKSYHSYYFSPKKNMINKVLFSNCLFEAVFRANHGTTRGYEKVENGVKPVFAQTPKDEIVESLLYVIDQFTGSVIGSESLNVLKRIDPQECKRLLGKSLRRFMWAPTYQEAEIFGKMQFSDDMLDDNMKEIAPAFTDACLRENHLWNKVLTTFGIRKNSIHESAWYEASVIRNGSSTLRHRCSYSIYRMLSCARKCL